MLCNFEDVNALKNVVNIDFSKLIPNLEKQFYDVNEKTHTFSNNELYTMLWLVMILIENVRMAELGLLASNDADIFDFYIINPKIQELKENNIPCQCVLMLKDFVKDEVKQLCDVSDMRWFDYVSDAIQSYF